MTAEPKGWERAVLRTGRGAAAIAIYLVFPFVQTGYFRLTPAFAGFGVVAILLSHAITGFRWWDWPTRLPALQPRTARLAWMLFAAFCGWGALSILWSLQPETGAKDVIGLIVTLFAAALFAGEIWRNGIGPLRIVVWLGLLCGTLWLLSESWGLTHYHSLYNPSSKLFDLNRNAAWLLMIICAAAAFADTGRMRRIELPVLWLLAAAAIFSAEGEAAKLGLIVALVAGAMAFVRPVATRLVFATMAAIILLMPLLVTIVHGRIDPGGTGLAKQAHATHRLLIWRGYVDLIAERPTFGWGLGSDRALGQDGRAMRRAEAKGYPPYTTSPHNGALEIWTDLGLDGALLAAGFLLACGWWVARFDTATRVAATQTASAAFVISMTGSSLYQGWWLTTMAAGFVLVAAVRHARED